MSAYRVNAANVDVLKRRFRDMFPKLFYYYKKGKRIMLSDKVRSIVRNIARPIIGALVVFGIPTIIYLIAHGLYCIGKFELLMLNISIRGHDNCTFPCKDVIFFFCGLCSLLLPVLFYKVGTIFVDD